MMAGFYIIHNAGIGLSCYAWGLAFGLGSLWTLASNAIALGVGLRPHGDDARRPANFFTFVTAHGPFELTAIVFAGRGGPPARLGPDRHPGADRGWPRSAARPARSLPIAGVSVILFILAAFLEGFVSASPLPYSAKAAIALVSAAILAFYLFGLGRAGGRADPTESAVTSPRLEVR